MSLSSTDPASTEPAETSGRAIVNVLYRDRAGNLYQDLPRERMAEAVADPEGLLWVDFQAPDDAATQEVEGWLDEVFHFHHLAVEDALQETHVPKVDDWGSYLYIVFRLPYIEEGSESLEFQEGVHHREDTLRALIEKLRHP